MRDLIATSLPASIAASSFVRFLDRSGEISVGEKCHSTAGFLNPMAHAVAFPVISSVLNKAQRRKLEGPFFCDGRRAIDGTVIDCDYFDPLWATPAAFKIVANLRECARKSALFVVAGIMIERAGSLGSFIFEKTPGGRCLEVPSKAITLSTEFMYVADNLNDFVRHREPYRPVALLSIGGARAA